MRYSVESLSIAHEVCKIEYSTNTSIFQLERIKLSHDHRGYGSGFFVDEVEVEVPSRNDRVTFPCNCWLAQDVDGGRTETDMVASQPSKPPQPSKLRVVVYALLVAL
jgi:hypothetical protein